MAGNGQQQFIPIHARSIIGNGDKAFATVAQMNVNA